MQSVGSEPTLSVNMWIQQVSDRSLLSFRSGRYQDFGPLCRLYSHFNWISIGSVCVPNWG